MMDEPINETLPATGNAAVLVSLPDGFLASDFAIQARGDVDMLIGKASTIPAAGTKYWTIKAGSAINIKKISGGGDLKLFYAVSGSTADIVEVIPVVA